MDEIGLRQLVDAIIVWTGWGKASWPSRDESLVTDRFGADLAEKLMPIIHELEKEFYSSDARYIAQDIVEMGEIAASQFSMKHPEMPEEIIQALSWCYTYDYK